uniref:PCI domain-containing protein n=1 Tax=Globodera rostochiensis TaxID=31243 RepID=A0A914H384_GLORO
MVDIMINNHVNGANDVNMDGVQTLAVENSSELNQRLIALKTEKNNKETATLVVKVLAAFVNCDNFSAAEDFVTSQKTLPESATNSDWARWFYYLGRIEALKGTDAETYKAAQKHFEVALRKAPQDGAVGFKQEVNKWIVLVKLVMGEIPERSLFRAAELRHVLAPYLLLTQAVRLGDVAGFDKTKKEFECTFVKDRTGALVERIHQSVIRTAIRRISTTYSHIYVKDMAKKLKLNEQEAHEAVIKAIKEGIVRAQLIAADPSVGGERYVKFSTTDDEYRGVEPRREYDARVNELLELYNQAVKALRYPDLRNSEVETIDEQRRREQLVLEMAAAAEEEDDDDF